MFRQVDLEVRAAVLARQSLILSGGRGSGKSCSLVNLAAWARAAGYFVVYVPSGRAFTQESSYFKDQASGLWDTPEHAQLFLQLAMKGNAEFFANTRATDGKSLLDLVKEAEEELESGVEPNTMVDVALTVIAEIKKYASGEGNNDGGDREDRQQVLFVVDEYNALHGPTDMHFALTAKKRGNIAAGSTRLNAALRDTVSLTAAGCTYVGATSASIQLSPKLDATLGTPDAPSSEALKPMTHHRLNKDEVLSMVMNYEWTMQGMGCAHPSVNPFVMANRIKTITQGNGKEMREVLGRL
jgi:hypothetical protein